MCVPSFDEMAIRPSLHYSSRKDKIVSYQDELSVQANFNIKIATNTLIFIAIGLSTNWKQILGFSHRSMQGPMLQLVVSCISKLQEIGLKVVSTVCDQGASNISLFNDFGLSVDKTFFQVANENIYFMFHPPQLLKSVRNNLLKSTHCSLVMLL